MPGRPKKRCGIRTSKDSGRDFGVSMLGLLPISSKAEAMLKILIHLAAYLFALLALCGLGYLGLSLWRSGAFCGAELWDAETWGGGRRGSSRRGEHSKPLRGGDRQMYESFRSHCLQTIRSTKSSSGSIRRATRRWPRWNACRGSFRSTRYGLSSCSEGQNTAHSSQQRA